MKTDTLVYIGGCSGSFPVPSENRPIWDPAHAPGGIRFQVFDRHRYGGRTTNFLLRHKDTFIMVDHGSGIDPSSDLLLQMLIHEGRTEAQVWAMQTHYHMDHINGTVQNQLLYRKGIRLRYFSPDLSAYIPAPEQGQQPETKPFMEHVLGAYFKSTGQYFPVPLHALPSQREHEGFKLGALLDIDGITVRTMALKHPGGCCGYRFEIPGNGAVVIVTDHEPGPDLDPTLVEFCDGARLLLVDMQYDEAEYVGEKALGSLTCPRLGWGHGTPLRLFPHLLACRRLPQIVRIIHHDPVKSDAALDMFYQHSLDVLEGLGGTPRFDYGFARGGEAYWL